MRKIRKIDRPLLMKEWFVENTFLPECLGFRIMPTLVKSELKTSLMIEQGFICAYTGLEIDENNSHIEHLKPYSKCKDDDGNYTLESYDYFNLVACFPKSRSEIPETNPKIKNLDFGAVYRENWYENFLSPLFDDCEQRFKFTTDGSIESAYAGDIEAEETILNLGLKSTNLTAFRKNAISGFLGLESQLISTEEMEILLMQIDTPNSEGKLIPFCFVIKQALQSYLSGEF